MTNIYDLSLAFKKEISNAHYKFTGNITWRSYRNEYRAVVQALDDKNRKRLYPRGKTFIKLLSLD